MEVSELGSLLEELRVPIPQSSLQAILAKASTGDGPGLIDHDEFLRVCEEFEDSDFFAEEREGEEEEAKEKEKEERSQPTQPPPPPQQQQRQQQGEADEKTMVLKLEPREVDGSTGDHSQPAVQPDYSQDIDHTISAGTPAQRRLFVAPASSGGILSDEESDGSPISEDETAAVAAAAPTTSSGSALPSTRPEDSAGNLGSSPRPVQEAVTQSASDAETPVKRMLRADSPR